MTKTLHYLREKYYQVKFFLVNKCEVSFCKYGAVPKLLEINLIVCEIHTHEFLDSTEQHGRIWLAWKNKQMKVIRKQNE